MSYSISRSITTRSKLGLVLSGGGARGAYHLGVIRAINELNFKVDLLAGASIGALNASVLASAPNLHLGLENLEKIWQALQKNSPLQPNISAYLKFLVNAGKFISPNNKALQSLSILTNLSDSSLLSDKILKRMINNYVDFEALKNGIPLYVSVFPSLGGIQDLSLSSLAALGIQDTPESKFIYLQALKQKEQKNTLLASAALPILFSAREIQGKKYSDGGQGGWFSSQGNIPIRPLIKLGCNSIIITSFTSNPLFNKKEFLTTDVIEIRSRKNIFSSTNMINNIKDILNFSPERINILIQQGYEDALYYLKR